MQVSIYVITVWNVIVMVIYGLDKLFARKRKHRISEGVLLTLALLMGGMGAMFGMVIFNHKTSKIKFRLVVPVLVLLNAAVFWYFRI